MNKTLPFALISLLGVIIFLAGRESLRKTPTGKPADGCMACHEPVDGPSTAHPVGVIGCAVCHLGNPFAREKERAHMGLVGNPGNLRHARRTCGQVECHPGIPERVEKSIMATNRGILTALQTLWPHEPSETVQDVIQLISRPPGKSLALDHFRKMCGGCHLWKTRHPGKGEIGRRGGGCTNCHISELSGPRQDLEKPAFKHPRLTTRIPNENCLKCHNRSARIGLSYLGRFESDGYGTPFEGGEPGQRKLSGGRFYSEIPPDVHHGKAGLDCIDCHTERGLMGDGNTYGHMEEQVDIRCNSCHDPRVKQPDSKEEDLYHRLKRLNGRQPSSEPADRIFSPKGSPLYNLRVDGTGKIILYRKRDGKKIVFNRIGHPEIHRTAFHERLNCQACHSARMPQCYGCHVALLKGQAQNDWLTGRRSKGRWVEGRSYIRFGRASLGIWPTGQIGPFAPGCQVFLDIFDEKSSHQPESSITSLVMASFDPHTTALSAPGCPDCHMDPKVLGLGDGALKITAGGLEFSPLYDSRKSGMGIGFPLDGFVTPEGKPLQLASRKGARPFNGEELKRITGVARCLPCHDSYKDPVYLRYHESMARFQAGRTPCNEKRDIR